MRMRGPLRWGILILTLDQLTKQLFKHADRAMLPGVLHITGTRNTGAAFGLFGGGVGALSAVTGLIILCLAVYLFVKKPHGLFGLGLWLALFGAIGNLIDRIFLGYVIDFIELKFIHFPVFNVADMALTLGCALAAIAVLAERPSHG